jgi:hypothetical protein
MREIARARVIACDWPVEVVRLAASEREVVEDLRAIVRSSLAASRLVADRPG